MAILGNILGNLLGKADTIIDEVITKLRKGNDEDFYFENEIKDVLSEVLTYRLANLQADNKERLEHALKANRDIVEKYERLLDSKESIINRLMNR